MWTDKETGQVGFDAEAWADAHPIPRPSNPSEATLYDLGMTKTIYSLLYPEVEALLTKVVDRFPHRIYHRSYEARLDGLETEFFNRYIDWSMPHLGRTWFSQFPHRYATAGSSEAIRDSIVTHKAMNGDSANIIVFEGEYEGYSAFAEAVKMNVWKIKRGDMDSILEQIDNLHSSGVILRTSAFYISQPSSLDGNIWDDFPDFVNLMGIYYPELPIRADICYLGALTEKFYTFDLNKPNIDTVFFSLSKTYGVYYHRIGGAFYRNPQPTLYGNRWFKNAFSLVTGIKLMEAFRPNELPLKHAEPRRRVMNEINEALWKQLGPYPYEGYENVIPHRVFPSHAYPLATLCGMPEEYVKVLNRGTDVARVCLTPALNKELWK